MLELFSLITVISLAANITCNAVLTNLLLSKDLDTLLKDPPKYLGFLIVIAMTSKGSFYISLMLTLAALISKVLP